MARDLNRADRKRLLKEREVFRATGYATVFHLVDGTAKDKLALHSDPDTLERIGWAWIARQAGLDNKKWIHYVNL